MLDQRLTFDFKNTNADIPIVITSDVPAFPFEDMFVEAKGITEMHSNNSMAILGDSLEVLRKIKSNSVKLIFADAPYNIGKDFGNNQDKWETADAYISCKIQVREGLI